MKKTIINIIMMLFCVFGYGQIEPSLPPSPKASSFAKYIESPVSLYTGKPKIEIPLYEIKNKDISIPLSLSYNPDELSVSKIASNVGLGWSLNGIGVITRAVKNIPDDSRADKCNRFENYNTAYYGGNRGDYPHCGWGYLYAIKNKNTPVTKIGGEVIPKEIYHGVKTYNLPLEAIPYLPNTTPENEILKSFGIPEWNTFSVGSPSPLLYAFEEVTPYIVSNSFYPLNDMEPDIFYFNFPGFSGKFVFDVENGKPQIKTIPHQNLRFEYQTNLNTGKIIGFTVTDNKGNVYEFTEVETSVLLEKAVTPKSPLSSSPKESERRVSYNSSWWLTKIRTFNGRTVNYMYEEERYKDFSEAMIPGIWERVEFDLKTLNLPLLSYYTYDTKRIKSIYSDNIMINFEANHDREDLISGSNSKALTSLTVNSLIKGKKKRVKKIKFNYDYFLSSENKTLIYDYNKTKVSHNGNKRLRLQSLQEFGVSDLIKIPKYEFKYKYYDEGNEIPDYKKFPNRYSYNLDLWGYTNGARNETPVPSLNIYPDNFTKGDLRMFSVYPLSNFKGRHITTLGGDRLPNSKYIDIGVLSKITYPTGGSTSYSYEPHTFLMNNEVFLGGGLRINKIEKKDNQEEVIIKYRGQ